MAARKRSSKRTSDVDPTRWGVASPALTALRKRQGKAYGNAYAKAYWHGHVGHLLPSAHESAKRSMANAGILSTDEGRQAFFEAFLDQVAVVQRKALNWPRD